MECVINNVCMRKLIRFGCYCVAGEEEALQATIERQYGLKRGEEKGCKGGQGMKVNSLQFYIVDIHIRTNVHYSHKSAGWLNLQFRKKFIVFIDVVLQERKATTKGDVKMKCKPVGEHVKKL